MMLKFMSACVAICVLTATGRAQDIDVLKAIPADADGFVVVKNIGQFDKKYSSLLKRVAADSPGFLEFLLPAIGIDQGLDRKASCGIVIYAPLEARKEMLGVLPVEKFQSILDSTGAKEEEDGLYHYTSPMRGLKMAFFKKGNFLLFTDDTEHGRKWLLHAMQQKESVVALAKDAQPWLATQDVAAVMLPRAAKTLAKLARQNLPNEFPGVPEEQEKLVRTQIDWLRGLAKSVAEEVTYAAIGGTLDADDNMTISAQASYADGGRFAKMAGTSKSNPIADLPGGSYIMAFGAAVSPEMLQALMKFGAEATKTTQNLTDAQVKELTQAANESLAGMESMSVVVRRAKGNESLFSGALAVLKVADAKSYLKTYTAATQRTNKIMKISTTLTTVRFGDYPAVEMTTDIKDAIKQKEKDDPAAPLTEHLLKEWFGGDKVSVTLVAVDDKTVLLGYVPAAKMKQIAQDYVAQKKLAADPATARTLKMLPENLGFVTLVNPKEAAQAVSQMLKGLGQPAPIPEIAETPPIGIGARASETKLDVRLGVPVEVLNEVGRQVRALKGQ